MDDWIELLRSERDATSNRRAGERIGYSAATVSQVLSEKYRGDLAAVERAVMETLGTGTVTCPVLGEIALQQCAAQRRKPFSAANPTAVTLWRACRRCPNNPAVSADDS